MYFLLLEILFVYFFVQRILFLLKKNDKVERLCFLYGVLFFFLWKMTPNIKYTLYHLWASKMVENRLIC